jgi:DNA-directed RNA polymerase II subunit RPB2
MGKAASLRGISIDGSPFNQMNPNDIGDILANQCGFERNGKEVLYNGKTGEQIETAIFIGPTYYHRLKHMVQDKLHSRASGPYSQLVRQPSVGRARDGGLRMGRFCPC